MVNYTVIQMFVSMIFLREVSYAYQDCIYLIKNTVKTVIFCDIITTYNN